MGKNLLQFNKTKGYLIDAPTSRVLNLLDKISVNSYIESSKPDMVIHCAGKVGGIQANIADPVAFLAENMQMGLNLVMSSYVTGIKNFINMGSSCMYPKYAKNPLKEEVVLKGELEPTNEGYAIAKIAITKLCEYISRENEGFQYKTIVPCNLYGKYDKFNTKNSHMIPAVIKKIHEAKISNTKAIEIWGDGEARREFMYTGDLADFTYYALDNFDYMPQNINVGLGYDYTINEYYKVIAEVVGFKGEFVHNLTKPEGMRQKLIDNEKLVKFGWKAKTDLKVGLEKTYKYFLKEVLNEK